MPFGGTGKPDKEKCIDKIQKYQKGLKMKNLKFVVKTMKSTWFRRLVVVANFTIGYVISKSMLSIYNIA